METIKSNQQIQLQAKSLKKLDGEGVGPRRSLSGAATESEFDQELLQASLVSLQGGAPVPVLKPELKSGGTAESQFESAGKAEKFGLPSGSDDRSAQDSELISAQTIGIDSQDLVQESDPKEMIFDQLMSGSSSSEKSQVNRVLENQTEVGQGLRSSRPQVDLQTLASKFPAFSQTTEKAWAGPADGSIQLNDDGQNVEFSGGELDFSSGIHSEVGGHAITGQKVQGQVNTNRVQPQHQDPSQPVQVGNFKRQWVTGNDFMNTRNDLINSQRKSELSDSSELMVEAGDSPSQSSTAGIQLPGMMLKERPKMVFDKRIQQNEISQWPSQVPGQKSAAILSPGSMVPQIQAMPLILVKERARDQKGGGDESLPTASSSDSRAWIQVPQQGVGTFEMATQSIPKSEVNAQVSSGPNYSGQLAPEGLSNLGLGILRTSYQGGGEIRVRLRPDHLGELNIRVLTDGNRVGLKIQASDERAKKILEESIGSLKENLSSQSLNLGTVDFSVAKNETTPEPRSFQNSTGFQNDSGQGRNQNSAQSERFYDEPRSPRQNSGMASLRSSLVSRAPVREARGESRLDVTV